MRLSIKLEGKRFTCYVNECDGTLIDCKTNESVDFEDFGNDYCYTFDGGERFYEVHFTQDYKFSHAFVGNCGDNYDTEINPSDLEK